MKRHLDFKKAVATLILVFALCLAVPVFSGALITASETGTIYGNIRWYHGKVVRFTLRDNGWPNALRDIVIRPDTHIFVTGDHHEWLSPNVLYKGEEVRCQGGLTTFFDRLVAQRIIILSR